MKFENLETCLEDEFDENVTNSMLDATLFRIMPSLDTPEHCSMLLFGIYIDGCRLPCESNDDSMYEFSMLVGIAGCRKDGRSHCQER